MLQGIRDRAHGWIAWVVVILIAIPFALWGIQEYFGTDPNVPIATVNDVEIPLSEFQVAYQRRQQSLAQTLGRPLDLGPLEEARLKEATVSGLIEEQLLLQLGRAVGLRISDEQLAGAITTRSQFMADGQFSQRAYDTFLARTGYSPGRFEEALRQNMMIEQLATAYAGAAIATESELERLRALQGQRRTYSELVLSKEAFRGVDVSDADVQAHYEANRDRYVTEEQVQVQYLALTRSALEATVTADEDTLRSLYQNRIASYTTPEQRRASHILVTVDESTDDATALARIEAIKAELESGADFATLAQERSEDPGSARDGGDLGFSTQGTLDPRFERVMFELSPGTVSDPVRTGFGYHLIMVTEVRPSTTRAFEEARSEVLHDYRRQQAEQLYYEQVEQLSNLAFEHPDNLDVAAESLGLTLQTTEFFGRNGLADDLVFSHPRVVAAAFSPEVIEERANSEAVEIDGPQVVVLRVLEHRRPTQRSLDEVRDEVVESLRQAAAQTQAERAGLALLGRLRSGEDPQAVAAESELEWSESRTVRRDSAELGPAVRHALFRMPHPGGEGGVFDAATDGEGNFRILRLTAVAPADDAPALDTATLDVARAGLAQLSGHASYRALVDSLRAEASVRIYDERL